MFTLTKIFPQIGWAVPTAPLACLPPLTIDDEFHTWGALPQVQMGKGWAGNRYHKQHAMLSVPFCLTYFSTRNSSTQVSASNPVLLFHCSCHRAQDKRRKRGEQWQRSEVQEVHMSTPFTCPAFSSHNWTSESIKQCFVRTVIMTDDMR